MVGCEYYINGSVSTILMVGFNTILMVGCEYYINGRVQVLY